ncbi:hypothetical protein NHX12_030837 [Muraenolepis orangiensis]|uniref:Uncharacterized protein n=1 Tax=Muraenolepis orangiensis TaxID=630683 RepID=A0A9Q0ECJ6_9TELE|nr:hypothetical protein NHX12_030837 [Muraenolepis orangiensis]
MPLGEDGNGWKKKTTDIKEHYDFKEVLGTGCRLKSPAALAKRNESLLLTLTLVTREEFASHLDGYTAPPSPTEHYDTTTR